LEENKFCDKIYDGCDNFREHEFSNFLQGSDLSMFLEALFIVNQNNVEGILQCNRYKETSFHHIGWRN